MDLNQCDTAVSHAAESKFENFDPEGQFQIRDLGVKEATGGAIEARILAAAKPCNGSLGQHRHDVDFQMFYVLKGSATFYFEGTGEVEVTPGSCVNMSAGVIHDMLDHSDDLEFIEIISPAQHGTEWMKAVE